MKKINTAIFISGRGSNLESLIKFSQRKNCSFKIAAVISNNNKAKGLNIAKKNNIPIVCSITKKLFENNVEKYLHEINLICLAGFMQILSSDFVKQWHRRLLNIHPSYLPAFKGLNAQQQAIDSNADYSGCTVHYVSPNIDSGQIILQKKVKILKKDNTESLSKKILIHEHKIYPKAVEMVSKKLLSKMK